MNTNWFLVRPCRMTSDYVVWIEEFRLKCVVQWSSRSRKTRVRSESWYRWWKQKQVIETIFRRGWSGWSNIDRDREVMINAEPSDEIVTSFWLWKVLGIQIKRSQTTYKTTRHHIMAIRAGSQGTNQPFHEDTTRGRRWRLPLSWSPASEDLSMHRVATASVSQINGTPCLILRVCNSLPCFLMKLC